MFKFNLLSSILIDFVTLPFINHSISNNHLQNIKLLCTASHNIIQNKKKN